MMRWLWALIIALPVQAQEFTTLKGHGGPVMALDVSPAGQLASASFDNSVGLWPGPVWLEGHDAAVTALAYAPGPRLLSGSDDFRVLMWQPDGSAPIELTRHQGKIGGIAVDSASGRIATASWDGSIRLFDTPDVSTGPVESQVLLGHRSSVTDVAFGPDGKLYSTSADGTLRIWEGVGAQITPRVLLNQGFGINRLVVTADWIAYGAVDGATRVVDHVGNQIADFTLDRRPVLAMDYHAQTDQLAIGDGHGYIMVIDTADWHIARDFRAMRQGPVWALAYSQDGAVIHAGGLDDVIYGWPVDLLDQFNPAGGEGRSFLREADTMPNGERQFMRKCSICHALGEGPSRKAGPTLYGVFGRRAGTLTGYTYSETLGGSDIIWSEDTIDALFDQGPDHFIPGSKMPMQVIAKPADRQDLIAFLKRATAKE